ncbi:FtsK/SpoIIIE domain-containing protein [Priestia filamentosa]|uniref:FtsK/SpoIIIE domain-containing protein n=1 Tax=Priestia filamentosa TaxID=1402861 RepID=UPI00398316DF
MIAEIAFGSLIGGLYLKASMKQKGGGGANDHEKIIRIAEACDLTKQGQSLRLHRKTEEERFTEYVYQIPQGLSFRKFEKHIHEFQDGLNIKKREYEFNRKGLKELWRYLKEGRFNRANFRRDIHNILFTKNDIKKSIKMSYDGMLHFKVFEKDMETIIKFEEFFFNGCYDWRVPLGDNGEEMLNWRIGREHMAIAGGTRQGKTQFLKLLITSLLQLYPEQIKFSLIDLKGGVSFQRYKSLMQTVDFAEDIYTATDTLNAVYEAMLQKQKVIKDKGFETADEAGMFEKHFVIIDEAAELSPIIKKDERERRNKCQQRLSEIARLGAGLNYILIFCTQYPTVDVMSKDIKSNLNQVVCFKLRSGNQSQVVLDEWGAEKLECPGRALVMDGVSRYKVQVPLVGEDLIKRTIQLHINIKPRKDEKHAKDDSKETTNREHTLIIEEV